MSWIQNVLAGDSLIKQKLQKLAERSKDENLSPRERLLAMMELGTVVQAGEQLQSMIDELAVEEAKPKYVWRNGARVKV